MKRIILPFIVVLTQSMMAQTSSEMISDILSQYNMLGGKKALVVAIDEDRYAAGWGFQFASSKGAIAKAMSGCQKSRRAYQVISECKLYMLNNKQQQVTTSTNEVVITTTPPTTFIDKSIEAVVLAEEQSVISE